MSVSGTIFTSAADDLRQDYEIGSFREYVRRSVPKHLPSLEIGPSFNPVLEKRQGYNLTIVDHADRESLKAKYAGGGRDLNRIEEVDYVWESGHLFERLGTARFDAIVAAHLIEHAPDFIGFLQDCRRMLTQEGKVWLLVPDRRYCFDYFQSPSDVAKVLSDRNRDRHSFESFYRHHLHATAQVGTTSSVAWTQAPLSQLTIDSRDPKAVLEWAEECAASRPYIDSHANFFTPASFALIINELSWLDLVDTHIDVLTRARNFEFLVVLGARRTRKSLSEYHTEKRDLLFASLSVCPETSSWIA
jgi:hypothetical protein